MAGAPSCVEGRVIPSLTDPLSIGTDWIGSFCSGSVCFKTATAFLAADDTLLAFKSISISAISERFEVRGKKQNRHLRKPNEKSECCVTPKSR